MELADTKARLEAAKASMGKEITLLKEKLQKKAEKMVSHKCPERVSRRFWPVSRNGLLLCVQFVFTTLNNSLLFLVPLRELSRELRIINYDLRKILGMTN